MSWPLPQNNVSTGEDGHLSDHDNIYTSLSNAQTAVTNLGGDLSGDLPSPTVAGVNGVAVTGGAPGAGQVLTALTPTTANWQNVASNPTSGFTLGWVNVTTFGADPSGSIDSTTAINNAVASLPANGGVVYLPTGTYKISAPIVIGIGVTLMGDGATSTNITQTSTTANGVNVLGSVTFYNSQITNLRLNGPNSGSGVGIFASADGGTDSVAELLLSNLVIYEFGSHGIYLQNTLACALYTINVTGCKGRGFYFDTGTSTSVVACWSNYNANERGFYLFQVDDFALTGCISDGAAIGYEINGSDAVSLSGCAARFTAAANSLDGSSFKVSGASTCVSLTSCRAQGNAAAGYYFTGSSVKSLVSCCTETASGSPTAGLKVDSGSSISTLALHTATATSNAGTINALGG